jgi:hypothetical protein
LEISDFIGVDVRLNWGDYIECVTNNEMVPINVLGEKNDNNEHEIPYINNTDVLLLGYLRICTLFYKRSIKSKNGKWRKKMIQLVMLIKIIFLKSNLVVYLMRRNYYYYWDVLIYVS